MTPRVLNSRHEPDPTRPPPVYIGRPSKWGNDHVEGWCSTCCTNHTRAQAIEMYERDLDANPRLLASLPELTGRDLTCWCTPKTCHGDVLLRRANP